jgi:16S rRNA (cytosine967-C5)-methyltransferase
MTPGARVQAAIEILDLIIAAARANGAPADRIVGDWFRTRRFAGSKDRRAVRELAYAAIRACGPVPATGRVAMLRLAQDDAALASLFDGSGHAPAPVQAGEVAAAGGIAPAWLEAELAASGISGDAARALLDRAPLDLRVNTLKADPALLELPLAAEPGIAPNSLRLPHGTQIESWEAYTSGQIEVQDAGSQLVCAALGVEPGQLVIDLCAGAGGKTLGLAAAMDNRGRLIACDVDRPRLSRLEPRAVRAGVTNVETRLLDPNREVSALADLAGMADAVLVDAPCSGTGTWRRNPEARWRLTPDQLARYAAIQGRLLNLAAGLVRPGGRLGFVTCSLLDAEGADQVERFLADHPGWQAEAPTIAAGEARGAGVRLSPQRDQTDGFFVACLRRP